MSLQNILLFCIGSLLCLSCQSDPAEAAAIEFCNCSEPFVKIKVQYKSNLVDETTFEEAEKKHLACMGDHNPLEAFEGDPEGAEAFKITFLNAIHKQCPEVAQNMGF